MTKHEQLSKLSKWELVQPEQDIRGWEVHDRNGQKIGRVDDLLVSTDTELVEVVRLEDGQEFPTRDIEIGNRVVYLKGQRPKTQGDDEPVVKVYDDARVRPRDTTGTSGTAGTTRGDRRDHDTTGRSGR